MNKRIWCLVIITLLGTTFAQGGEIHDAVKNGDFKLVCTLLDDNPNLLENYSADGFTPLHVVVFYGKPEIVEELLVKRKANANAIVHGGKFAGWSPYHLLVFGVKTMEKYKEISFS